MRDMSCRTRNPIIHIKVLRLIHVSTVLVGRGADNGIGWTEGGQEERREDGREGSGEEIKTKGQHEK